MSARGIILNRLAFAGDAAFTQLDFVSRSNLIYGASNTGKSFGLKALDFMLGSQRELPDINERQPYSSVLLTLTLPKSGQVTLIRAMQGGPFTVVDGVVDAVPAGSNPRVLSARHDPRSADNLSQFLLSELGLGGKQIATDASGSKRGLSFRDLVQYCLIDETSIQAERSPVESGNAVAVTAERSVFKLLITGQDDSALQTTVKARDFQTSKAAKLEVVTEMLKSVEEELAADFPHSEGLGDQSSKLDDTLDSIKAELEVARTSIRAGLDQKRQLANSILLTRGRLAEIAVNVDRFEQLAQVYRSDIERLESIEEAGFLLLIGKDRTCPLCGALPEAQRHSHGVAEIEKARDGAKAEIAKIQLQQSSLVGTLEQMKVEEVELSGRLITLTDNLTQLEAELQRNAPQSTEVQRKLEDLLKLRDQVRRGLELLARRDSLRVLVGEYTALKQVRQPRPKLGVQSSAAYELAEVVASVLRSWEFPGKLSVNFDDQARDIRIDGKHRRDNGKGVRAITHAAFKIGLFVYCHAKGLPHPGFVVLDSPLVTYRDPMTSKGGALTNDEEELRRTTLKQHFFDYLAKMDGQSIVLENVDPPTAIETLARVSVFTGQRGDGRAGLL